MASSNNTGKGLIGTFVSLCFLFLLGYIIWSWFGGTPESVGEGIVNAGRAVVNFLMGLGDAFVGAFKSDG